MDPRIQSAVRGIGEQLRAWRGRRHLSQLALALQADVSSRHLSFVETGRAQPGRELVLRLAEELDVPLRERNALLRPPINVIRLVLHPGGLAPRLLNHATWRSHYLAQLRRQIQMTADPELELLLRETLAYPGPADTAHAPAVGPAVPLVIETRLGRLSFVGATMVFGSAADVTLEEVALELLHPADAFTESAVRSSAETLTNDR